MPIAPVAKGGDGAGGAPGGYPGKRREAAQIAAMNKAAKAFSEDMEPWQWEEYEKGWSGPLWSKKKSDFVWARIPGKHPDVQLARRGVSKKERLHKTSGMTRLQRSAADVFAVGGIPGMGVFLGMVGIAGPRTRAGMQLFNWGISKNQSLYLPGGAKAKFTKWQDAGKLTGAEREAAQNLLGNYRNSTGDAITDIGELTREQSHLIAHQVKTGERIQPATRVRAKKADVKKFADDGDKAKELAAQKAKAAELARANKAKADAARQAAATQAAADEKAALQYLDPETDVTIPVSRRHAELSPSEMTQPRRGAVSQPVHETLSQRGKDVTRQTKPFEGVQSRGRESEFGGAVQQSFDITGAQQTAAELATQPRPKATSSFQGIPAPDPAPPRGRPRTERVSIGDGYMSPQQADVELSGMVGGTTPSKRPVVQTAPPRKPDLAAQGREALRAEEAARLARLAARSQQAALKELEELITAAKAKPPASATDEALAEWAKRRPNRIKGLRKRFEALDLPPEGTEEFGLIKSRIASFNDSLAHSEKVMLPRLKDAIKRAETDAWRKAYAVSEEAALTANVQRSIELEGRKIWPTLTNEQKKYLGNRFKGDFDKIWDHLWKHKNEPAYDAAGRLVGSPARDITLPVTPPEPRASLRSAVATQMGPAGKIEQVGGGAVRQLAGAPRAYGGAVKGLGRAARRNPIKATALVLGATGAAAQKGHEAWGEAPPPELGPEPPWETAPVSTPQMRAAAAPQPKQDWWNLPHGQWPKESAKFMKGFLRKVSPEDYKGIATYTPAQLKSVFDQYGPQLAAQIRSRSKATQDRIMREGYAPPSAPPRPGEAWVQTPGEQAAQRGEAASDRPAGLGQ